jgi:serine/threonine-protein kinase HipA
MDREVLVYVDLQGRPQLVGRLWARLRKDRETATFEYDTDWLAHPERFSMEPVLKLGPGPFHAPSDKPLFGAIGDSAPDRWGRVLMRRAERRRAEREGTTPRTVREIDYLLLVDDEARQGALRFAAKEGGPFLADQNPDRIPPLVELPRLLSAAEHVIADKDSDEDFRLLLAPGSSLGGARPKASVRDDDGHLSIAKFPNKGDEVNTVAWEAVALTLAEKAGIPVPQWRLEAIGKKPGAAAVPVRPGRRDKGPLPVCREHARRKGQRGPQLPRIRGRAATAWRRAQAGHARSLAPHRVQHPDFEHGRPSAQPRISLGGTYRLAAFPGVRSQSGARRCQAKGADNGHRS